MRSAEILVEIVANAAHTGPVSSEAVRFRYYGNNSDGKEVLTNNTGDIDLRAVKEDLELLFILKNDMISLGGSPYRIQLLQNAMDALWIFEKKTDPKQHNSADREFVDFNKSQLGNREMLSVKAANFRKFIYDYALAVKMTPRGGGPAIEVRDDPQIKNGGLQTFTWTLPERVLAALTGLVALLLIANLIVGIRLLGS